jgi:hypothetical protein
MSLKSRDIHANASPEPRAHLPDLDSPMKRRRVRRPLTTPTTRIPGQMGWTTATHHARQHCTDDKILTFDPDLPWLPSDAVL